MYEKYELEALSSLKWKIIYYFFFLKNFKLIKN
jgi:hypothetical protein